MISLDEDIINEMKLFCFFDQLGTDLSLKLNYIFYVDYNKRVINYLGIVDENTYYVFTEDGYMRGAPNYIAHLNDGNIDIKINLDMNLSEKMKYAYIKPTKYLIDNYPNMQKAISLSSSSLWDDEVKGRYDLWRNENFGRPTNIVDKAKDVAIGYVYLIGFIIVISIIIYLASLLPSDDCVDADRFGVHQVCGDDIYK